MSNPQNTDRGPGKLIARLFTVRCSAVFLAGRECPVTSRSLDRILAVNVGAFHRVRPRHVVGEQGNR